MSKRLLEAKRFFLAFLLTVMKMKQLAILIVSVICLTLAEIESGGEKAGKPGKPFQLLIQCSFKYFANFSYNTLLCF